MDNWVKSHPLREKRMSEDTILSWSNFLKSVKIQLADEAGDPTVPEVEGENFFLE